MVIAIRADLAQVHCAGHRPLQSHAAEHDPRPLSSSYCHYLAKIIAPPSLRASHAKLADPRSPLKNSFIPAVIGSSADMTGPLPLQFAYPKEMKERRRRTIECPRSVNESVPVLMVLRALLQDYMDTICTRTCAAHAEGGRGRRCQEHSLRSPSIKLEDNSAYLLHVSETIRREGHRRQLHRRGSEVSDILVVRPGSSPQDSSTINSIDLKFGMQMLFG
ncbi:hypothetical protein MSG28_014378 [Choristoneura fumiferana]|uniref:Uncharacterized protein n=1 Tax=Choristoneura fumiferana TaxID=7141 RepID=A0ACC0JH06_CHOFU|nr:hypothetical protein MSG28_014378 [Choristoneura fumiferana]